MKILYEISSKLCRQAAVVLMAACGFVAARADEPEGITTVEPDGFATVEVNDSPIVEADSVVWKLPTGKFDTYDVWMERDVEFNPTSTRHVLATG